MPTENERRILLVALVVSLALSTIGLLTQQLTVLAIGLVSMAVTMGIAAKWTEEDLASSSL